MQHQELAQNVVDVAVGTTTIAIVIGYLPAFVAFLTGLYTVMRIIDEWPKFITTAKKWFK